jgi:hypothetical protein
MGSRWLGAAGLFVTASLLVASVSLATGFWQSQELSLSGDRVAVHNLVGEIQVVRGSGSDVRVEVQLGGADAERLDVQVSRIDGVETLRVMYPDGDIVYPRMQKGETQIRVQDDGRIFGDGGRKVKIKGSGSGTEAWADLTISVPAGKSLGVHNGVGPLTAADIQGDLLLDTGSGAVSAMGIQGELTVDTGSGAVEVRDVSGLLSVDTGSGRVMVEGAEGPTIVIDTGSGAVTGSNLTAEELFVDTGSGRVELVGVRAQDIMIDTGSGGVDLELLSDVRGLVIDTGSGAVNLAVPDNLGAKIEIDTGSGRIDFDFPITVTKAERSYVYGQIGDGVGEIQIETGSGGVKVRKP